MILRDMALGQHREILDAVTLVVVPIYNVDGHERVSPYNRPNQDGPRQGMGFRTTAGGLDLNRDHLKLATEEARSLIALVNAWRPHLHVDNHVTDGVDHDWVLTWAWAEAPQAPAPVDAWLRAPHAGGAGRHGEGRPPESGPTWTCCDGNDPAKGLHLLRRPAALLHRLLPAAQPAVDPGRDALLQALPRRGCSPTATSCWPCSPRSPATRAR